MLEASYDSIQHLATDVESALSHLKTRMDVKFDVITTLIEKGITAPAQAAPETTRPVPPEKP